MHGQGVHTTKHDLHAPSKYVQHNINIVSAVTAASTDLVLALFRINCIKQVSSEHLKTNICQRHCVWDAMSMTINADARFRVSIAWRAQLLFVVPQPLVHHFLNTVGVLDIHASLGGSMVHHLMWQHPIIVNVNWWIYSTLPQWNIGHVRLREKQQYW